MAEIDPDRLKALRQGKKWSRAKLGDKAKVSQRQIARLEIAEGITPVRGTTLERLARAFKVDANVLSGQEPLPEEYSDPVPTEAFIDPSRLRALRDGLNLSRDKLANQSGVSARQIARIEGQEEPADLRPQTLASLARALNIESAVLTGEKPLPPSRPQSDGVRFSGQMGSATRLDYDLVSRRYGVTAKQVIDLAPLLFAMLAEGSLAWRREKLAHVDQALSDLRNLAREHSQLYFASLHVDIDTGCSIEERSIAQADVLGDLARDEDNELGDFLVGEATPFADYMRKLANDIDQPDIISFEDSDNSLILGYRHEIYGVEPFRLCGKDIDEIAGNSKYAQWALLAGDARISDIPQALLSEEAKDQRIEWLEDRLSDDVKTANEDWESFMADIEVKL